MTRDLTLNGTVESGMVGENWPSSVPGQNKDLYGSATLTPTEPVEIRSFQTFTLTYTVGKIGIDDNGGIRVAFRKLTDHGLLQTTNPAAENFVSVSTNGDSNVSLSFAQTGQRPWMRILTVHVRGGYLKQGDTITIVIGDTSHGSPGWKMQTFAEPGFEFRVLADIQATHNFVPLDQQFSLPIVAGPPAVWKAVLPSQRRPGEAFHLGVKAEDAWGNPTRQVSAKLTLVASLPVENMPETITFDGSQRSIVMEGLSVTQEGELWIDVMDGDTRIARAGPLVIKAGDVAGYWGDLHGQTGETIGIGTLEGYLDFARNKAFLDVTAHQANDFQINAEFWTYLNKMTAKCDEPHRFTVFPGYEWSGNTAIGGDHNVYFRHEDEAIIRCSHALLEDRAEIDSDAQTLTDLFRALKDIDCVVYGHVGGRYANIHYDHDPNIETAYEIHSAWGTFEWIMSDSIDLGRRVGVVANSDGHKMRPGASFPGAGLFGAYGGLTCFLAKENTRDGIFEAMRRRHHYATTGCRMYMDVRADLPDGSVVFERNPQGQPDAAQIPANEAIMGDIVKTPAAAVDVHVDLKANNGVERLELRSGNRVLETLRPYAESDLGNRLRFIWSGAKYRGRGRETSWKGLVRFDKAKIARFEPINLYNLDRKLHTVGSNEIVFETITTGNYMGFDVWLDGDRDGQVEFISNQGNITLNLNQIGLEDSGLDADGLDQKLRVFRLPTQQLGNEIRFARTVDVGDTGDTPIWISAKTEDGFQAWSTPIYLFR